MTSCEQIDIEGQSTKWICGRWRHDTDRAARRKRSLFFRGGAGAEESRESGLERSEVRVPRGFVCGGWHDTDGAACRKFHVFRGGVGPEEFAKVGVREMRGQSVRRICGRWWHDADRAARRKSSRFSRRRWGRGVAKVGVREVEVRVPGGFVCGGGMTLGAWLDRAARRKFSRFSRRRRGQRSCESRG